MGQDGGVGGVPQRAGWATGSRNNRSFRKPNNDDDAEKIKCF